MTIACPKVQNPEELMERNQNFNTIKPLTSPLYLTDTPLSYLANELCSFRKSIK